MHNKVSCQASLLPICPHVDPSTPPVIGRIKSCFGHDGKWELWALDDDWLAPPEVRWVGVAGSGGSSKVDAAKSDNSLPIQQICIRVSGLAGACRHFVHQKYACAHKRGEGCMSWTGLLPAARRFRFLHVQSDGWAAVNPAVIIGIAPGFGAEPPTRAHWAATGSCGIKTVRHPAVTSCLLPPLPH